MECFLSDLPAQSQHHRNRFTHSMKYRRTYNRRNNCCLFPRPLNHNIILSEIWKQRRGRVIVRKGCLFSCECRRGRGRHPLLTTGSRFILLPLKVNHRLAPHHRTNRSLPPAVQSRENLLSSLQSRTSHHHWLSNTRVEAGSCTRRDQLSRPKLPSR